MEEDCDKDRNAYNKGVNREDIVAGIKALRIGLNKNISYIALTSTLFYQTPRLKILIRKSRYTLFDEIEALPKPFGQ